MTETHENKLDEMTLQFMADQQMDQINKRLLELEQNEKQLLLQLAGTNTSGLLTLINVLVSQLASTGSVQVSSGLNTRINNVIASIPNQK